MEGRNKDEVAKDRRKRMFLTTYTPSTFTYHAVPLSSHYDCRAAACPATLLSHLLLTSALLAAIPPRFIWLLHHFRSTPGIAPLLVQGMGVAPKATARDSMQPRRRPQRQYQAFVGRHPSTRIRNVSNAITSGGVLLARFS